MQTYKNKGKHRKTLDLRADLRLDLDSVRVKQMVETLEDHGLPRFPPSG